MEERRQLFLRESRSLLADLHTIKNDEQKIHCLQLAPVSQQLDLARLVAGLEHDRRILSQKFDDLIEHAAAALGKLIAAPASLSVGSLGCHWQHW
jgi:hypothetical protein